MGCSISLKRPTPKNNDVRIVHLNGHIARLDYPATVAEVTGDDNRFFLFNQAQLLSNISKPLAKETVLEAGKVYFSLPRSLLESGVTPTDLAHVAKKLASKVRKDRESKGKHGKGSWGSLPIGVSSCREMEKGCVGMEKSSKSRSWKPSLDTIRERSFNRRSESDFELSHVQVT